MPLPVGGPWPPKPFVQAMDQLSAWSAWYSGDADELSQVYMQLAQRITNRPHARPSQYHGGLVGTLARWFWGQPIPLGEKRAKVHVPIASDIAQVSSDLLFSEPPTFTVEDTATQDQIDELLDDTLHAQLIEAAEVAAGLGGVYLRAVWDKDTSPDRPWLSSVHGDAGIPEWSYGKLTAVTFFRVIAQNGSDVIRHLERHEVVNGKGVILHGVYCGSSTELGKTVPLTEYPDTAGLVDSVVDGNRIETGIDQLTACYVPNMRPNRRWRNQPAAVHLGRSDYSGSEPLMDALDETMTSWMRDIRLGKGRIVVPDAYLMDRGPGKGALWDADREAYEGMNMLPGASGSPAITVSQFAIRVKEHSDTMLDLMTRIIGAAGYSGQTFGLNGDVAVTATEVAAKERRSLITRDKKIRYWRPELATMVQVLLKLGQVHFGWKVQPERPGIEFSDVVQQDPQSLAQTLALYEQAKAVSTETKVRLLHPDWDDDEVNAEVAKISDESGINVVNPDTMDGNQSGAFLEDQLPGTGDPDDLNAPPDIPTEALTPAAPPLISATAYQGI